jgi:1-acyl-sn-glycerol-3-phosphate acyltransferase
MIKADHKYWARLLYDFYIKRLLKSNFQNFYIVNEIPAIPESEGLIVTPNHFSWWDGFFIDYTVKCFSERKIFLLMLEEQLKRYWFFKKVGAFSINQKNPKSISETFHYMSDIVSSPQNYLAFYPQGEIEAYDKRPLTIKEGLKILARKLKTSANILPAAFKINYSDNKKPDVFIRFGKMISSNEIKDEYELFIDAFNSNITLLDKETSLNQKYKLLY